MRRRRQRARRAVATPNSLGGRASLSSSFQGSQPPGAGQSDPLGWAHCHRFRVFPLQLGCGQRLWVLVPLLPACRPVRRGAGLASSASFASAANQAPPYSSAPGEMCRFTAWLLSVCGLGRAERPPQCRTMATGTDNRAHERMHSLLCSQCYLRKGGEMGFSAAKVGNRLPAPL